MVMVHAPTLLVVIHVTVLLVLDVVDPLPAAKVGSVLVLSKIVSQSFDTK